MSTIMIVDDSVETGQLLSAFLEGVGHKVTCVTNGQEALNHLRNGYHPSLIFLDLVMPVMDGYRFLEIRQLDAKLKAIPVVVISGLCKLPEVAAFLNIEDYLAKPTDVMRLLDVARQYCA